MQSTIAYYRPQKVTASLELAAKLKASMQEKGVSKTQLATACDVRVQSVYTWLKHGRVAKHHLPTFARVFGKPLGYWLDDESEDDLAPDERQLLAAYRALSKNFKGRLLKDAEHLQSMETPPTPPTESRAPLPQPQADD